MAKVASNHIQVAGVHQDDSGVPNTKQPEVLWHDCRNLGVNRKPSERLLAELVFGSKLCSNSMKKNDRGEQDTI